MTAEKRVACIGAGEWGKNVVRNFHELGALGWVCETDPARRAQVEAGHPGVPVLDSPEAVLDEPAARAVAIATPAATHGELVRRALAAGKDVLVEKPLCLSVDEGRRLVEMAAEAGRVLMVGHVLWYHPAVLKLKALVDSGELGRIQYIYSNRVNLGRFRREESSLWSFAPHDLSVILGLLGEMPSAVQAHGGHYLHHAHADVTVSLLSFPSGVRAHVFVSWLHPFKEQKLVVVGDRRMAVFDDTLEKDKLVLYPHEIDWKNRVPVARKAPAEPVALEWVEPLRAECAHFLECVHTRATPRTDGAEALRVLEVLDACERALASPAGPVRPAASAPSAPHFVHESAYVDEGVEIGEGTKIWHFSHVLRNSRIGRDCRIGQNVMIGPNVTIADRVKIQNNVSVYEGVTLEEGVFCGPSMVFTNVFNPRSEVPRMDELRATRVRRGATLGANCTILCGLTIGEYAFVGAGAVVLKDLPDHALAVGNPARIVGWMCTCGNRIAFEDEALRGARGTQGARGACAACGREYVKAGDRVAPAGA